MLIFFRGDYVEAVVGLYGLSYLAQVRNVNAIPFNGTAARQVHTLYAAAIMKVRDKFLLDTLGDNSDTEEARRALLSPEFGRRLTHTSIAEEYLRLRA